MNEVYVISKPLHLYDDSNYFFGNLQKKRKLSIEELYKSFPKGRTIKAYTDQEDAERAVRTVRRMRLVEDENNIKGFDYHSRVTPIIFKVKLRKTNDEISKRITIDFDQIDKKTPVKVICLEKNFDGLMPQSIDLDMNQFSFIEFKF